MARKNIYLNYIGEGKKVALCPSCHKFFSIKKLSELEMKHAQTTGFCPVCFATRQKKGSAFSRVKTMLLNTTLNEEAIAKLQDKEFTQKKTGVAYAILSATPMELYGKKRYSTKPVMINGKEMYISNDIYEKNVEKIANLLSELAS
jgi:hypothetical protein